jgi:MFS superfamily sulfate permease-like transporter
MTKNDLPPKHAPYGGRDLRRDFMAAVALATIAIPSQIGTVHLAGFPSSAGLIAFAAGTAGFAVLGANRFLVVCADSTMAPIFAGGLAAMAATGSGHYFGLSASFALIVGAILLCVGLFRLGWLANLVSIPVTIGFLAGIAFHIVVSQLPYLFGITAPKGGLLPALVSMLSDPGAINPVPLALGLGVLSTIVSSELISPFMPGALLH